ncbi:metabolite traffic protein EboE [Catellatospora sp. KI3]|uniref:metabolite traffic protein EboE n=1 Tax=Catellatospora sp. KI3 TaxID=3041620 RepID=UPI0024825D8D|nr:metabolite traffic protein EboE [Catellatospora sp. KI3]MDI1459368.1 metabolite traffic protein EboE [Catellatospora sp. KI3]
MRLAHRDGQTVHLSYCTNVHPAEDLDGIVAQLDTYGLAVRKKLDADVLGLGLWLAAPVAAALAHEPVLRRRLRAELDARGLEVVTLNGFPYQAFHADVVKHDVYHPDWTTRERLTYTLDLARVLADLLPDDAARGSISTLPVAWRQPWGPERAGAVDRALAELADGLAEIAGRTGRTVQVGFEPEPGCVVENTHQAARLWSGMDGDWLGVCLDLAHLACAWEEPAAALARLARAGLPVVKVQVSAALAAEDPVAAASVLRGYAEPKFLHQTRSAAGEAADDLDQALDLLHAPAHVAAHRPSHRSVRAAQVPGQGWRVHFHVPLHVEPAPPLASTLPVLRTALRELYGGPTMACDHVDVETYTWSVLPPGQRPDTPEQLAAGIAAELAFAREELRGLGLVDTVPGEPAPARFVAGGAPWAR